MTFTSRTYRVAIRRSIKAERFKRADKYHPVTGAKRERNLTDEQRQELADRLARARENK